nr:DUF6706 family protein [uncultured Draconibacterium sp.]
MTITDYIKSKFQTFGISMSEADLFDIWPDGGDSNITTTNKDEVDKAIAGFIPQLLLRPKSVSEGGYSVSYDVDAIKEYYAFLCKKYELEDVLSSRIIDKTDTW